MLLEGVGSAACTNAQKRELMPLCIGHEVTAGVRDTIDLVERVGKVGNTRSRHRSRLPLVVVTRA